MGSIQSLETLLTLAIKHDYRIRLTFILFVITVPMLYRLGTCGWDIIFLPPFFIFSFAIYTLGQIFCYYCIRYRYLIQRLERGRLLSPSLDYLIPFNQRTCGICLDPYSYGSLVDKIFCGHIFHPICLTQWCETRENAVFPGWFIQCIGSIYECPLCKWEYTRQTLRKIAFDPVNIVGGNDCQSDSIITEPVVGENNDHISETTASVLNHSKDEDENSFFGFNDISDAEDNGILEFNMSPYVAENKENRNDDTENMVNMTMNLNDTDSNNDHWGWRQNDPYYEEEFRRRKERELKKLKEKHYKLQQQREWNHDFNQIVTSYDDVCINRNRNRFRYRDKFNDRIYRKFNA